MTTTTDSTVTLHHIPALNLPSKGPKPQSVAGDVHEVLLQVWASEIAEAQAGVWEATLGSFSAAREGYDEICYITNGRATVMPENGDPVELAAGDLLVTPCGWRGVWHVYEDLRKVYVIVRRPTAP